MIISYYIFQLREFECEHTLTRSSGPFDTNEEAEDALRLIIKNSPPADRIDEELNYTILPIYKDQKPNKLTIPTPEERVERIRAYAEQAHRSAEVYAINYLIELLDGLDPKSISNERTSLIRTIEDRIKEIQDRNDSLDDKSWGYELGILLSGAEGMAIIRELKHTPKGSKKQEEQLTKFLDAVEGLIGICNRTGMTWESAIWQQKVGKVMALFQNYRIQQTWK